MAHLREVGPAQWWANTRQYYKNTIPRLHTVQDSYLSSQQETGQPLVGD